MAREENKKQNTMTYFPILLKIKTVFSGELYLLDFFTGYCSYHKKLKIFGGKLLAKYFHLNVLNKKAIV